MTGVKLPNVEQAVGYTSMLPTGAVLVTNADTGSSVSIYNDRALTSLKSASGLTTVTRGITTGYAAGGVTWAIYVTPDGPGQTQQGPFYFEANLAPATSGDFAGIDARVDSVESSVVDLTDSVALRIGGLLHPSGTDITSLLDAAITTASQGKRTIEIGEGTYICHSTPAGMRLRSGTVIRGAGKNRTILKLPPDTTDGILGSWDGATDSSVDDVEIEGITFDGDQANSTAVGGAGALLHSYKAARWRIINCAFINSRGYGFGWQGFPLQAGTGKQGPQTDLYMENCDFVGNGRGKLGASTTVGTDPGTGGTTITVASTAAFGSSGTIQIDSEFINYVGTTATTFTGCKRAGAGTTAAAHAIGATVYAINNADGCDIKTSERVVMVGCHAYNNTDKGINVRGRFVTLTGCWARYNDYGFDLNSNDSATNTDDLDSFHQVFGGGAEYNLTSGASASATADTICHADFHGFASRYNGTSGAGQGLQTNLGGTGQVRLGVHGGHYISNATHGISVAACQALSIIGAICSQNGTEGIRVNNQSYGSIVGVTCRSNGGWGIRSIGTSDNLVLIGNVVPTGSNTSGPITLVGTANNFRHADNATGQTPSTIASATTIAPSATVDYVKVSGTTTIVTITATQWGHRLTLHFTGACTVNETGNIRLGGAYTSTADSSLTVICDGTNWIETGRSIN